MDKEPFLRQGKFMERGDGGYPLYYIANGAVCMCAKCATENKDEIFAVQGNYENPDLYCDECSERIPSAYAEPDSEVVTVYLEEK